MAVALRMQPVADGTDHGGSLRNPPAFNNVYGLRTCWGRIPAETPDVFSPASAFTAPSGARTADIALMLSVQAGYDPRLPQLDPAGPGGLRGGPWSVISGVRIAWAGDFGGRIPFDPGVLETCRAALAAFEDVGCFVDEAVPEFDIEQVWNDWGVLRAFTVSANLRPWSRIPHRAMMKPEAVWEAERGLSLSADQVMAAQVGRTRWYDAMRRFMEVYDFVVMPTAQVFPFDTAQRWPETVGGRAMDTYHRWMQIAVPATMAGLPALAVPAGFGPGGLPWAFRSSDAITASWPVAARGGVRCGERLGAALSASGCVKGPSRGGFGIPGR